MDFSSAFNTICCSKLLSILEDYVSDNLIILLYNFLFDRTQYVHCDNVNSSVLATNTGVPQGCCLSPLLFAIYTDSLVSFYDNVYILKYADDTAIIGLCNDNNPQLLANYNAAIKNSLVWCKGNYLFINNKKTKEMIVDFRAHQGHDPVFIGDNEIEVVSDFKYLGITFSSSLTWSTHVDNLVSKARQRLFCIRRLAGFGLDFDKQLWLFQTMVFSFIVYCGPVWLSSCCKTQLIYLNRVIKMYSSITDDHIDHMLHQCASAIVEDSEHPLSDYYVKPRRLYTLPRMRTERFRRSFLPRSLKVLNCMIQR